ncbi:ABC transporter ATP-binding protein [Brucella cytisi]|uniref:Spermidine/putrescine import ATP-binding protein PotA n=1 Tax=Brucella cytisi TaxID=407152 RepID=A0A1J6HMR1_9HYPH|nr:ABC transporter ATP-binding protein [Brucella cytisi]OIS93675.1 ABC transporter ATP-binding protein [Brucella cytisi]
MTSGAVSIRQIHKAYGSYKALDGISLDIAAGEFLTLLGPSGSGKTTLLNVIAGFERPDSGSLLVDDREFITMPPHKRDLGMVFQNYALFPHMDVFANVAYPLKLRKIDLHTIKVKVMKALETVHMDHLGARRIHELSGGQRQRVALARAIVFEPRLLLMDEPLSALDKNLREHMQIELKRLHRTLGTTTVYVTHDQQEALTMSDRIAVLDRGRIMQLDTPRAIYDAPNCKFVAGFMGDTRFVPVIRKGSDFIFNGHTLKLVQRPDTTRDAYLMVRPERLRWQGDPTCDNRIEGRVIDVTYLGDSHLVSLELAQKTEISVRHMSSETSALPRAGDHLALWMTPQASVIVEGTRP